MPFTKYIDGLTPEGSDKLLGEYKSIVTEIYGL